MDLLLLRMPRISSDNIEAIFCVKLLSKSAFSLHFFPPLFISIIDLAFLIQHKLCKCSEFNSLLVHVTLVYSFSLQSWKNSMAFNEPT